MAQELTVKEKVDNLAKLFEKSKGAFAGVLPAHLSVTKMLQIAIAAAQRNPKLLECTPSSLIGAMLTASELGLEVGGAKKHSWLVPFFNGTTKKMEATFIPDYRGLMELCRRSGKIKNIHAYNVYSGDAFDYDLGSNPYLRHKPCGEDDDKKITHSYVVFTFNDGTTQFFVMTRHEIEKRRNVSKAKDSNFWTGWFPEMCLKTVIKRGCTFIPQSTELAKAIDFDNRNESDIEIDYMEIPSLTEPETGPKEKKAQEPQKEPEKASDPAKGMSEGAKPSPEKSQEAKTDEKTSWADKISAILEELCPGAEVDQADLLEIESAYDTESGHVAGKRSVKELSEGRQRATYLKLKKLKVKNAQAKS